VRESGFDCPFRNKKKSKNPGFTKFHISVNTSKKRELPAKTALYAYVSDKLSLVNNDKVS